MVTDNVLAKGHVWLYKRTDGKALAFSSQHAAQRYAALDRCLLNRRLAMNDYKHYYTFAAVAVVKVDNTDRPNVDNIQSLDPDIAEAFVEKVMALPSPSPESSE